jgi:hypothetical protein
MAEANTPTYYDLATITTKKTFIVEAVAAVIVAVQ